MRSAASNQSTKIHGNMIVHIKVFFSWAKCINSPIIYPALINVIPTKSQIFKGLKVSGNWRATANSKAVTIPKIIATFQMVQILLLFGGWGTIEDNYGSIVLKLNKKM